MTTEEIEAVLNEATGSPVSGVVHDVIPGMARALHRALNGGKDRGNTGAASGPAPEETRVVKAKETR
jgi:hypothetical protein